MFEENECTETLEDMLIAEEEYYDIFERRCDVESVEPVAVTTDPTVNKTQTKLLDLI